MRENHNDSDLRDVEERLRRASTAPDDAAALSQLRSQVLRMVTTTPSANAWGRRNALAAAAIPLAAAAVIAVSLASTRVTPPTAHTVAQPSPSATPTMPPSKLVEPEVKPSPYISRLQMVTPTLGWATTSDPVGVMDELVKTSDGGRHWSDAGLSGKIIPIFDALDRNTVWVGIDQSNFSNLTASSSHDIRFYLTADGGRTWQARGSVSAPPGQKALSFYGSQYGWFAAMHGAGGAINSPRLFHTADGGRHWKAVASLGPAGSGTTELPQTCQADDSMRFSFTGPRTAFAAGLNCFTPWLQRTTVGGSSWAAVSLPSLPPHTNPNPNGGAEEVAMDPPSFSSSTAGRLIVRAGWTTGANALQFAALYSTVDSGASWKVQTLPAAALAADLSHALDVFFFAAGPGGNSENQHFWRSHDGGKTWHESPAVLGWYPVDVQFVDGLHGWTRATTKTSGVPVVLNSTADAGETWQDLQPVFPTASPSPTAVH